jgi:hypothetical protein
MGNAPVSRVVGRIQNAALVRESDPRHQRRLLLVLLALVAVAAPVVFYVWLQTRFVATQYELQELRVRLDRARERQLVLDARLQGVSSPARVRENLRRLGLDLEPPTPGATRMVRILHETSEGEVLRAGASEAAGTGEERR